MPDLPSIDDAVDPRLSAYYEQLDALTAAALAGGIDEGQFIAEMERVVTAAALLVYLLGGGTEATAESDAAYQERRRQNLNSIRVLADDIYSGRYSESDEKTAAEGRNELQNRLLLWTFGLAAFYDLGKSQQSEVAFTEDGQAVELTETWHLGSTEQHCATCAGLDGITLTIAEWNELGLDPRGPDLNCGGWRCDCSRTADGLPSDGIATALRALGIS